jgi:hypothetical protein
MAGSGNASGGPKSDLNDKREREILDFVKTFLKDARTRGLHPLVTLELSGNDGAIQRPDMRRRADVA